MPEIDDPSWPRFLNDLYRDPQAAMSGFYEIASRQLRHETPRPLRYIPAAMQGDAISDFFLHCFRDDLRVLKLYVNKGRAYAGWLHLVATNYFLDWIRRNLNPRYSFTEFEEAGEGIPRARVQSNSQENRELLERVQQAIGKLGENCRLLLELAAEEFEIKEIVTILRYPKEANIKVSNDLRYCRKKLIFELQKLGISLAEYLPS